MRIHDTNLTLLGYFFLFISGVSSISCGREVDKLEKPRCQEVDNLEGSFRGRLTVWSDDRGEQVWTDAVVTVSKVGVNRVRVSAKCDEEYSQLTTKTFTVEVGPFFNEKSQDVVSLSGSVEGVFIFDNVTKELYLSTSAQSDCEFIYKFEGRKGGS